MLGVTLLLVCCAAQSGCSTPASRKVSPAALTYVRKSREDINKEINSSEPNIAAGHAAQKKVEESQDHLTHLKELANKTELTPQCLECSQAVLTDGKVDATKLNEAIEAKKKDIDNAARAIADGDKAEAKKRAAEEALDAKDSGAKYVATAEPFFSFTPLVAFRGGLNSTAIPAVAVNVQPFDIGKDNWLDLLGLQAVFGGALNPNNDNSGPSAAAGAGLWYPIGGTGSVCIGYVLWQADSDTRSGWYIGLTLGQEKTPIDSN